MDIPRAYMFAAAAAAAAAAIFILDLYSPLGLALGTLYLIPLAMVSMWFGNRTLFTVAGISTGLLALGFVLSPPGLPLLYATFNRALDIALLWLAAWFLAAPRTGLLRIIGTHADSTNLQQALLDAAPDATVTIDRAGRIAHVNRQMEQVFGYRPDELLGQPIEILIPAHFHQSHQAHRNGFMAAPRLRAMGEGQALFARRKNGAEFPVEISLSPINTAEGQQVIASIRDITARKQAESTLRDIRDRLDLALKGSSDGLWDWDITTGNDYLSPRWKAMLGFQDEELPNRAESFFSRVHPDDAERVSAAVQAHLKASAPYDLELRLRMKDESYRWFRSRGEAVRDAGSKPTRMVGLITDITAHKQTEEALRLLQQIGAQFVRERDPTAALDQIVEAAITIMQADRGTLQLLDARTGELLIKAHRGFAQPFLDFWSHVAKNQGAYGQAMAQGKRVVVEDVTHSPIFADPPMRDVMMQAGVRAVVSTPLRSRSGTLFGMLSVHYRAPTKPDTHVWPLLDLLVGQTADLLDRTQTEQALRQSEAQLRQSQKMEAVGTLAGGIAHDFNNLLTVMLGYSALALTHLQPEHPLYRPLDEIRKAGERATSLTSQLLAFSRQQVLSAVVLDLNQLINTMGQLLRRLIGEQIELEINPQAASPLIEADRGQIEHILVNLAINARDAMPTGGQLRIETTSLNMDEAEAARHEGLRPGPYVRLTIRDSGHGMDQATQARVFEPFFTTKPQGKGTGLGLAMVYGSVKQSGGAIWVDSQPQGGTTFTLCFPLTKNPLTVVPLGAPLRRGQETILLVEDEPAVRTLTATILFTQGYRVLDAPSGQRRSSSSKPPTGQSTCSSPISSCPG